MAARRRLHEPRWHGPPPRDHRHAGAGRVRGGVELRRVEAGCDRSARGPGTARSSAGCRPGGRRGRSPPPAAHRSCRGRGGGVQGDRRDGRPRHGLGWPHGSGDRVGQAGRQPWRHGLPRGRCPGAQRHAARPGPRRRGNPHRDPGRGGRHQHVGTDGPLAGRSPAPWPALGCRVPAAPRRLRPRRARRLWRASRRLWPRRDRAGRWRGRGPCGYPARPCPTSTGRA